MNILIAGGCDIPPPYGGLAALILNNAAIWEREHNVHLLLLWAKPKRDLLEARRTHVHAVYPAKPRTTAGKLHVFLRVRLPRALATLIRKPALSVAVVRELRLLMAGRRRQQRFTALVDALTYAAAVDDLLIRERIQVVQAHYGRQETLLCEVVAARRSIPVVVVTYAEAVSWTEDGEDISAQALYSDMREWDALFQRTYRAAAHLCAPSAHCAQGPRRFVPATKVTVAYPGIDTTGLQEYRERREEYATELGVAGEQVILFVGQLAPRKGPQFLAQAAPDILRADPSARIVFVGSDVVGYRKELETLVASCGNRVVFAGAVSSQTLWKYYAVADVLAFPASTDRECIGMSMEEAQAVGTPVVAFRAGGTPEAVEDGKTGYLVSVGDVEGLADRLLAVLRGELGPEARERCRARARRLFDIEVSAELQYSVLADAVASLQASHAVAAPSL